MDKKKLGFAALLIVFGGWIARETVSWMFGKALDALAAGTGSHVTFANFPWQNLIGVILIGVGIYLAFKSDKRAERNSALYGRMKALYDRLSLCVQIADPILYPEIMGDATTVFESVEQLGIPTPDLIQANIADTYRGLHLFVGAVMALIRDGHLNAARREADKVIRGLGVSESRSTHP